jgi:hypothetical protein
MQDMDDDHLLGFNAVEDQVLATNAPTYTVTLEVGDEGEAIRSIKETLALAPQLSDKRQRAPGSS